MQKNSQLRCCMIATSIIAICSAVATAFGQQRRTLWVAKFSGQVKAATAIAAVQKADLGALQYSGLFEKISSFASNPNPPAGSWVLSGIEVGYYGGNVVKRSLLGLGTGRAHIIMEYKLRSPQGDVVWTKRVKSEPSLWNSAGLAGSLENQNSSSKQAQQLVEALSKFFHSATGSAPPAAEPKPSPGKTIQEGLSTIVIKSTPSAADITVDGNYMGSTPSTLQLKAGKHVISVTQSGFKTWQRTILVTPGGEITVSATLEKRP